MRTLILPFDERSLAKAVGLLAAGQPVAVGTETVYGLAADATNPQAVAAIYAAKGRPAFNPLIVHVPGIEQAERIAAIGPLARALAEQYWPGPLTIVVPLRAGSGIAPLVTAGLPTIALRVPAHPPLRALLEAFGRPLAAPSANRSGSISPTRAEHVERSLSGQIPLILDCGPCPGGIESTIVSEMDGALRVLRRGPVEVPGAILSDGGAIEAPGQMRSHYAPGKPLRLEATSASDTEYLIGFGTVTGDSTLSRSGDLNEAAARLFDQLHIADRSDRAAIAVAPVPDKGLGAAINDRLRRAAAPA